MAWTEQAVETMRRLWPTHSARQVAMAIWDEHRIAFTRNAVVGKLHRLGLPGKSKTSPATSAQRSSSRATNNPLGKKGARGLVMERDGRIGNLNNPTRILAKVNGHDPGFKERKPVSDEQIPAGQRVTLMELTSHTCRWPIGTPGRPDFFFCGSEPIPGLPYCCVHTERAWEKAKCRKSTTP